MIQLLSNKKSKKKKRAENVKMTKIFRNEHSTRSKAVGTWVEFDHCGRTSISAFCQNTVKCLDFQRIPLF